MTNLYLVPTLYHDLMHHHAFAETDVCSVRKLGFAGAPMTDGLLKESDRRVPAGAVRQSLWLVGNLHLHHRPGRAEEARLGRPRRHQPDDARREARRELADELAAPGEEGEIIALASQRRSVRGLLAPARSRRQGAAARAGISPATPAMSTRTATSSSPAGSTT